MKDSKSDKVSLLMIEDKDGQVYQILPRPEMKNIYAKLPDAE